MNKKWDVLVVGELNVDVLLYQFSSFPEVGKEVVAEEMQVTMGSSSAIFAANVSALGARTAFVGCVGNDYYGDFMKNALAEKGVDTQGISTTDEAATGITFVLNVGDDRAMLTYPGAMNLLTLDDVSDELLQSARHLHFSSIFLQPNIRNDVGKLFQKAKKYGLTTSFDMQWDPTEKWAIDVENILPYVDFFFPNEAEILALTQTQKLETAIAKLFPHFKHIVVKRGSKGASLFAKKTKLEGAAFRNATPVDAIGAGDSFNAGFVFQFLNGGDMESCLRFANLTGAINTTAKGGTAAFQNYQQVLKTAQQQGWELKKEVY